MKETEVVLNAEWVESLQKLVKQRNKPVDNLKELWIFHDSLLMYGQENDIGEIINILT